MCSVKLDKSLSKKIFGIKNTIPFEHFYTITPTNFTVLSEDKQKRKLDDFFSLLRNLDKEIMITLERTPITVNHKGKDTKMDVLQVLLDSIDPLDDILEKIGFSVSIEESHPQIIINNEYSKMFSLSSMDKNYGRAYTLYKNPSRLPAAWIHTVFSIFDKIRIHISPVLPDSAMKKIDNKELLYVDNTSQKADIQKKIADIRTLKHDLELGNNMIFDVIINGFVFADTKEEILKIHQRIMKNLNSINVRFTTSMGQQQNIINGDGVSWIYDIESTGILYPFSSSDMLEIPNGILLGINKDTGSPVIYDPDNRANHNIFAAGTTGSGKSFTMKIIVMRFLEKRPDIMTVIIDPQGEYLPHAKYFGLDSLEIKPGKQYGLDPFKLFDTAIEAADIIGIVTEAPIEVKKEWRSICDGITNLDELYEKSSEKAKKYLEDLVKGSMSEIFKGDIKFSDRMIISLKHLDGQEYEGLFILLALTYAWKRVNALPSNQWKFLLLDEAWRMTKIAKSAYKIGEIGRQGRKKSLIFAISTQQFTDLDKSLDDESKLTELFDTKIIMGMSKTAAEKTGVALDLTADEIERVKNFKPGNGLLQTGTNSIYIKFEATEDEEKIYFSTTEKKVVN